MTPLRSFQAMAALSLTSLIAGCSGSASSVTTTLAPPPAASTTPSPVPPTIAPPGATPPLTPAPITTAPVQTAPVPTVAPGGVDPNAPEVADPGDIPDDQAFVSVTSADGTFTVEVPEGWARSETNGVIEFTDKYNSIAIRSLPSADPATVESVRASGLADVATNPTFALVDVQPVTRTSGSGIVATYEIGSAPNAVTGKSALLSVERYFFTHGTTAVVLTLSGAKGADNVDPWKIVTDSLAWPA